MGGRHEQDAQGLLRRPGLSGPWGHREQPAASGTRRGAESAAWRTAAPRARWLSEKPQVQPQDLATEVPKAPSSNRGDAKRHPRLLTRQPPPLFTAVEAGASQKILASHCEPLARPPHPPALLPELAPLSGWPLSPCRPEARQSLSSPD